MKKILIAIGSILMLIAPFTTVAAHYGHNYNLFYENGFGVFGKIAYGLIVIGVALFVLSMMLNKKWISVIGIIPITLVLVFLLFPIVNTSVNTSGNGSDTIAAGMYAILAGGIILWLSLFVKGKKS